MTDRCPDCENYRNALSGFMSSTAFMTTPIGDQPIDAEGMRALVDALIDAYQRIEEIENDFAAEKEARIEAETSALTARVRGIEEAASYMDRQADRLIRPLRMTRSEAEAENDSVLADAALDWAAGIRNLK